MAKLRRMEEQSQLEAMRAAVRGDLERARARQSGNPVREPVPVVDREPVPVAEPEVEPEPEQIVEVEPIAEPEVEPEPIAGVEVEGDDHGGREEKSPPAAETSPEAPPVRPRRGFLSSLFRRG